MKTSEKDDRKSAEYVLSDPWYESEWEAINDLIRTVRHLSRRLDALESRRPQPPKESA